MARRTLITVAVTLTVVALFAAEADFWGSDHGARYDTYTSTLLTSFRVAHRGDIELDESQLGIVAMSPDAYLDVAERRFLTRRRLQVRAGSNGQPEYTFAVGSRERDETEAREFLTAVMPQIVRSTTIGARPRAEEILESDGFDALLREVGALDSNAARRIYLEVALGHDALTREQAQQLIRTAGREMTSSSRLRSALVYLAEELPSEWPVTGDLVMSAETIGASSEKGVALVEIVRLRGLGPDDVRTTADMVSTIPSGSEKGRTIVRIAHLEPSAEVVEGLLGAADTIDSSSERRRVLDELTGFEGLGDSVYESAIDVGYGIASSSEKASFLANLSRVMPADEALQQEYLDLTATIPATSEQARALTALLRSNDLPASSCAAWVRTAGVIPASSTAASLLVEAAQRCPSDERVWHDYLGAARGIGASSEQRRVLMALLERDDLNRDLIGEVANVAESAIGSSSERRTVIERAEQLLATWVEPTPAPGPALEDEVEAVEGPEDAPGDPAIDR